MNIKRFKNPSGKLVDSKDVYNGECYHCFIPNSLPPTKLENFDRSLVALLSEADTNFNRLVGMGEQLPNPYILLHSYIKKEAVLSSKIEGTQASLTDLFLYELEKNKSKDDRLGLKEISNYVIATEHAMKHIRKKRKISLVLIKHIHKILLTGVRGEDKNPGTFRVTQNAIVPYKNCPLDEIRLIPPPPKYVNNLMLNLQSFIDNPPKDIPILIQAAIIHYQFETIHPFNDGNGRIGRLLIPLYLCEKGNIRHALIYLSAFFEKYDKEYRERLLQVSQNSDWNRWFKYFLTAISEQSKASMQSVENLIRLKRSYDTTLRRTKASKNVERVMESLFVNPYTTPNNIMTYLNVSYQTAVNVINTLAKLEIIKKYDERKRNKVYIAPRILKIIDNA